MVRRTEVGKPVGVSQVAASQSPHVLGFFFFHSSCEYLIRTGELFQVQSIYRQTGFISSCGHFNTLFPL